MPARRGWHRRKGWPLCKLNPRRPFRLSIACVSLPPKTVFYMQGLCIAPGAVKGLAKCVSPDLAENVVLGVQVFMFPMFKQLTKGPAMDYVWPPCSVKTMTNDRGAEEYAVVQLPVSGTRTPSYPYR